MPRVKRAMIRRKRLQKLFKASKGFFSTRKNLIRTAVNAVQKSRQYAYRDRRAKKGQFRRLWVVRINAAARANGLSYSRLIAGLKREGIAINRKMLASIAVEDPKGFSDLAALARG